MNQHVIPMVWADHEPARIALAFRFIGVVNLDAWGQISSERRLGDEDVL